MVNSNAEVEVLGSGLRLDRDHSLMYRFIFILILRLKRN